MERIPQILHRTVSAIPKETNLFYSLEFGGFLFSRTIQKILKNKEKGGKMGIEELKKFMANPKRMLPETLQEEGYRNTYLQPRLVDFIKETNFGRKSGKFFFRPGEDLNPYRNINYCGWVKHKLLELKKFFELKLFKGLGGGKIQFYERHRDYLADTAVITFDPKKSDWEISFHWEPPPKSYSYFPL